MHRDTLRELTVFMLLLSLGVVGRWYELAWNFTPLAAVTVLGGYYFRRWLPALLLPISILTVSNLLLPAYSYWQVQLSVYVMMLLPLTLGRAARDATGWNRAKHFACCGFVPATAFYLVTNFAVWAFTPYYEKTVAGLASCYWMALPFYRWMLAGDLFFLTLLVGCLAAARLLSEKTLDRPSTSKLV
ncbi:MAG: DUF6580 family putative transport protein [Planctomycetota bacterium]